MKTGADMGNIYLTGMMGCGKSAIGKRLAERLELPFVDIDLLIEQQQKKTINEIFVQGGEALFRKIEANTLYDAAQNESGAVVSCGGGTVLADENVCIMRE
ncbi:MAG: shikimate kinase, partial [Christensenella sp.]